MAESEAKIRRQRIDAKLKAAGRRRIAATDKPHRLEEWPTNKAARDSG
jgi:hypothetical protein